jgi:hypothetical protein
MMNHGETMVKVIKNIYMKNRTLGKIKEKIDNYY